MRMVTCCALGRVFCSALELFLIAVFLYIALPKKDIYVAAVANATHIQHTEQTPFCNILYYIKQSSSFNAASNIRIIYLWLKLSLVVLTKVCVRGVHAFVIVFSLSLWFSFLFLNVHFFLILSLALTTTPYAGVLLFSYLALFSICMLCARILVSI